MGDLGQLLDAVARDAKSDRAVELVGRRRRDLNREDSEPVRGPVEERVRVVLDRRRAGPEGGRAEARGPAQVGEVEEGQLRAEEAALVGRVLADSEQTVDTDRMQ